MTTPLRTEQPSPGICKLVVHKIHTTSKPLLLLSQEQDFASHFPAIRRFLELREYESADKLMRRYLNYDDGESQPAYWFSIYAIKGRFHEFFVEAYQGQFCFNSSYLPQIAEIGEMPFWYAQALRSAIAGNYAEAKGLAVHSFKSASSIGAPLLLAGVLDILLKRPAEARNEWLSVVNTRRVLYPEQIGPSAPEAQAAEFLIHFRP